MGGLVSRFLDNTQIDTHPTGLLRASNSFSQKLLPAQLTTNTTDIHALSKFRNRDPSNQVAADLRLRSQNHRHRPIQVVLFQGKELTRTFLLVVFIFLNGIWKPCLTVVKLHRMFTHRFKYMSIFRHHTGLNYIYIYIYTNSE